MMVLGASDGRFVQKSVKVRPVRASIFTQAQRTRGSLSSAIPNEGVRNSWHAIKGEALFYGLDNMHMGTLKLGYNLMRHGYIPDSEFRNIPKRAHLMQAFATELKGRGIDPDKLCPKKTFEKLFDPKSEQNGESTEKLSMYRTKDLDHIPSKQELAEFMREDEKSWNVIDNGKSDLRTVHARSQGLYAWVNRNARKVILGKLVSGAASKTERQLLLQQLSRIPEDNILGGKQKVISGLRTGDVKQVRDAFVEAFYRNEFGEKPATAKPFSRKQKLALMALGTGVGAAGMLGVLQKGKLLNAVQEHFKEQPAIEQTTEQEQQGQREETQTATTERQGSDSTPITEDLQVVRKMLQDNSKQIYPNSVAPKSDISTSFFILGNADAINDSNIITKAETRIQLYEMKANLTPQQKENYEKLKALTGIIKKTKELVSNTELSDLEAEVRSKSGADYEINVRSVSKTDSLSSAIEDYDSMN